jgi:glyoxylase-like metal-dependent hydrolase (beta-lactamase superfamily II)
MKLGQFELQVIHENRFWIDGGAMFGVIPRVLWETLTRPDGRNRIALQSNLLLIQTGEKNVLVEAGLGDAIPEKWKVNYGVEGPSRMPERLHRLGLEPRDVGVVILTHLHFDHAGGCTRWENGAPGLAFPRAQHVVQEKEWQDAMAPDPRSRASYMRELLEPLFQGGRLHLVDGITEIYPGIQVMNTGGHTRGHQVVHISSGGQTALYTGDLIPTSSHLKIPYVAGVDLFPLETMERKEQMIQRAVQENWLVLFGHDTEIDGGYLSRDSKGKVLVEPLNIVT